MGLVWSLSLLLFLSFPLYEARLRASGKRVGLAFFDFGERGIPLIFWALFMLGLLGYAGLSGEFSWSLTFRWGLSSLLVLLILGLDLAGSTPVYKSGLHEDRLFRIALLEERCDGAGRCEAVCPMEVFEVDYDRRLASLSRPQACVQCGACLVQCPFDALYFKSPGGAVITPETVRRFKLNLLGSRSVKAPGA